MATARTKKITVPLGLKLVVALVLLLLLSGTSLVGLSTHLFVRDTTAMIQQVNADAATGVASRLGDLAEYISERMRIASALALKSGANDEQVKSLFQHDKDLVALFIFKNDSSQFQLVNHFESADFDLGIRSKEDANRIAAQSTGIKLAEVARGEVQTGFNRVIEGLPAIALALPLVRDEKNKDQYTYLAEALIRPEVFSKIVGSPTVVRAFAVDKRGRLLASSDNHLGQVGDNLEFIPSVAQMLKGKTSNAQLSYRSPIDNQGWLSTFHTVGFAGLGVIAEVPETKAFESAHRAQYRAILIALVVVCLFVFVGFLFSSSLARRMSQLVEATHRIANGDFKSRLALKGRDEIASLSDAFNAMAQGLQERDRIRDLFSKFHSREIAEKLLKGEVKLGGERREAIVFFSDIRQFTTMSEAMQPEEVVEMLNEYMTAMVAIIDRHGGVVDKYVGDAIMALWGVPEQGNDDAVRAVRASLIMRLELAQLNELRQLRGQQPLKIGMGINCGSVIAGNIGSESKMEYTVVGDAVNVASRVESMTKELHSDLLITESVRSKLGDRFELEACGEVQIRGKNAPLALYRVIREIEQQGEIPSPLPSNPVSEAA